ncbi:xurface protein [Colletotrichum higginsianum]|nr:xurface protein [Colletotrichum higginsianum]
MRGAKTPQEVAPSLDRGSSGGNQPISRTSVRSQTGEPTKPALPVLGPKPSDKSKDGRKEQPTSDATAGQVPQDKPTARSSQPRKAESSSQVGRDTLPNSDRTRFARNWYRHDPIDFDELDGPSSPPAEQTPDTRSEETPGTPLPLPRILPQPRSSKTDATDYKLAATAVAELFRLLQSPPEGKSRAKRTLSLPEASNRGSLERSSGVGEPAIHQERQVTKPSKKSKMPQMMSGIPETMSSVAYDTSSMPQKVPYAIQTRSRPPKISNAPQTVSGVPPVVSNVPQTASDAMQKAPSRPPKITNAPRVVSGVSQTMSSAPQKIKMPSVPRKISGQAGSQAMPSIPPQKRRTHEVVEEMPPSPANQLTVTDRSIAKKPSPARPLRSAPTSSQYPVVPSHQPQDTRSLGAAGSKTKSAGPAPKHATGAEKKDAVRSVVDTWRQKTASGSKANPDRGSKAPKPSTVKVADGKVKTKRTAPRAEPRKRRVGDTKKIPGAEKKRKSHPKDPGSLRVPGKEKRGGRSSLGHGKPGAHDTHTTTKISSMSNSTTNCPIYLLGGGSRDSDSDSDVENDDDIQVIWTTTSRPKKEDQTSRTQKTLPTPAKTGDQDKIRHKIPDLLRQSFPQANTSLIPLDSPH